MISEYLTNGGMEPEQETKIYIAICVFEKTIENNS
jgi:hypothetical protein